MARESPNPDHPTGAVELRVRRLVVHNRADHVPFPVEEDVAVNEEARLTHRYVDLRRDILQRRLRTRHRLASAGRSVLDRRGFIELETPILTRSTPVILERSQGKWLLIRTTSGQVGWLHSSLVRDP